MDSLNPKQVAELDFWKGLVQEKGEFFRAYRAAEYYSKVKNFPSWLKQEGFGLDLGCGCISVFECASKSMMAMDPLAYHYNAIIGEAGKHLAIEMEPMQGEIIPVQPNTFDFVVALNMIDHTPNPDKMLSEIVRVLKPKGKLYFEVNFDAGLYAPHYSVWDLKTTGDFFNKAPELIHGDAVLETVAEHNQQRYWVEFIKK